ncbi:MAG: GspH/FimT family pseudopilin [Deltaproteobacteria bacterium]|nr:GspH/FimT family pseudopilin [Deltaproteobacteria bacterium]
MRKDYGFTLIELIVIIAIMSVLAGIAVPSFLSYMPKHRLNGAARQVMGDLMAARMKAVKENTTVTVARVSDHEYKISTAGGEEKTVNIWSNYHDVTIGSFTDISFYSRGTAWGATITLTNVAGSTKDVKVHLTGRVKIE